MTPSDSASESTIKPESGITIQPDVRQFLETGGRIATLATIRKNGRPWMQPLWYAMDGDAVIIVLLTNSIATRTLKRTPYAAVCVDDRTPPYKVVTLECDVQRVDSEEELRRWLKTTISTYRPLIDPQPEIDSYVEEGCTLFRLPVKRVVYVPEIITLTDVERT